LSDRADFETRVLPHLDAAYNLARWLLRDERAAEDAVQEASLRAFRHLDALRGGDARPWLLGIVRTPASARSSARATAVNRAASTTTNSTRCRSPASPTRPTPRPPCSNSATAR
jgi:DNA-directed RNA polymerase specialized sigma24 family protein